MKTYDINDVLAAEHTLEPIKCRKCGATKNVTFLQYVHDAYCENCGTWQKEATWTTT